MMEDTAYHEAGHALMAVQVGARIDSVTIDPDWDEGPQRFGDTQIEWNLEATSEREFLEKRIMVALAGPVAEMIYTGDPFHPGLVAEWATDWNEAWLAASSIDLAPQKRLQFLEQITRELHSLLNEDRQWSALAALADELLAHETLEGEQVADVVNQWLRR